VTEAEATLTRAEAAMATVDRRIQLQRAAIEQAAAEVKRSEAEQQRAGLDRARYDELAQQQWVSSQRNEAAAADARKADAALLGARAALSVARHELDVLEGTRLEAQAAIEQARANARKARVDLERTVVHAPIDAEVLRVNVRPGEYAQAGVLAEPLMTLGAVGPLHVRVDIDEADAWRVHPGAPATAFLRGNTDIRTKLAFVRFEPDVVPKRSLTGSRAERVDTRVLQVLYRFEPMQFPARVGQQVDVHIESNPELALASRFRPAVAAYPLADGSR
jgi:HlyD family secretion protein